MGIFIIENGDKVKISNKEFINKYGKDLLVARFSDEGVGIILDHIKERQTPDFFTHDLNWQEDFKIAKELTYKELFESHSVSSDADAQPFLDLIEETCSLKISMLDNPQGLKSLSLFALLAPSLLENDEYLENATGLIADESSHVYRETKKGWIQLTC